MLQYHWNIEYSLTVHLFYGRFYLLTLSCWMVTKGHRYLHNQQLKGEGLSLYIVLVPPVMKSLIRFMFMATL